MCKVPVSPSHTQIALNNHNDTHEIWDWLDASLLHIWSRRCISLPAV